MASNTNNGTSSSTIQKVNRTALSGTLLLIPTLNEEDAIGDLIAEAGNCGFEQILVVDGFSTDQTRHVAENAGARVELQDFGKGKGCGVRTGMREFIQVSADLLCIIDGDGTNDPSFLVGMVAVAQNGQFDVVLGSRTRGPRDRGAMNLITIASNRTVSFLLGAKFRRLFTDIQTGYWVFTRNAVQRIYPEIKSTGFEIELEVFVKVLRSGLRVCEIPVGFRRRKGKTKFGFMMRIRNLYYMFKLLAS
jgi:dolichol-phosphate mannosyltransferase